MTSRWPGLGDCPPGTYPAGPPLSPEGYAARAPEVPPGFNTSLELPLSPGQAVRRMGHVPELRAGIQRVLQAGGALPSRVLPSQLQFFEQVWRRLPEQGVFSASLNFSNPLSIAMGSFRVPRSQALVLFELRPDVYTFSGADPFDWVPVTERRFAGQMGWDITIDGQRLANTRYELNPVARTQDNPVPSQNVGSTASQAEFAAVRAAEFGTSLGAGTAIQPQRTDRYGPKELPLSLWVKEGSTFSVSAAIFRRILFPVAFFEFDLAGVLMPAELAGTLFQQTSLRDQP